MSETSAGPAGSMESIESSNIDAVYALSSSSSSSLATEVEDEDAEEDACVRVCVSVCMSGSSKIPARRHIKF